MSKVKMMSAKDKKKGALVPRLRFPEFRDAGEWEKIQLSKIAIPVSERATHGDADAVLTLSAEHGVVTQGVYFGKKVAGDDVKRYIRIKDNDFVYNDRTTKLYKYGTIKRLSRHAYGIVSPIYKCFRFNREEIPVFWEWYFESGVHDAQLHSIINEGAKEGRFNISIQKFLSIFVYFPNRLEQQRIADCLSSLDERIAAEANKLDTLKDHKKGLLKQLFPAEGETLPQLRFPEFRDAGEWEEKPLLSVADYENGKAYEPHIIECGRYIVVNSRFISTDGAIKKYSNEPICIAKRGDILMVLSDLPNGKALAKSYYVNADDLYAVNQRVCRLTPHSANGKFLCFLLDRHPNLLVFDDGKNQTHLKKDSVLQCLLKLPLSFDEQQRIADCLSSLDELISAQTQKIDLLKTHKKGLMQQLFPALDEAKA